MFPVEKIIILRSYTAHFYFMAHYKNHILIGSLELDNLSNNKNLQAQEIPFSIKLKFITFREEGPCYDPVLSQLNPVHIHRDHLPVIF
jgi:hypothetical protein